MKVWNPILVSLSILCLSCDDSSSPTEIESNTFSSSVKIESSNSQITSSSSSIHSISSSTINQNSSSSGSTSNPSFDWMSRYELREGGAVVFDKVTKLEWERCSFGQIWTGSECHGRALVFGGQYGDEKSVINALGFRMPTQKELATLVYCSSGDPVTLGMDTMNQTCIDSESPTIVQDVFPITHDSQGLSYWTVDSTEFTVLGKTEIKPVAVRFIDGEVRYLLYGAYIRMVRSESEKTAPQLKSKYEIREEGSVVFDKETGIEWQRCVYGQKWNGNLCEGIPQELTQEDAELINENGFTLPTRSELLSLIYCSDNQSYLTGKENCSKTFKSGFNKPTIAPSYFMGTPVEGDFWMAGEKYYISFSTGDVYKRPFKDMKAFSRLMRVQ